jgi:hypothetical protein
VLALIGSDDRNERSCEVGRRVRILRVLDARTMTWQISNKLAAIPRLWHVTLSTLALPMESAKIYESCRRSPVVTYYSWGVVVIRLFTDDSGEVRLQGWS